MSEIIGGGFKAKMEANNKLFHGTLEVTIFHAILKRKPSCTPNYLSLNGNPAYVEIKLDQETVATTSHERDRVWNQTFQILCAHPLDSAITITVKTRCSLLGRIHFKAHQLANEASFISGFFPLLKGDSKKPNWKHHQLQLILWFKPAEFEPTWRKLINQHGGFHGLRNSSFPQRSNCGVTLYQDAHHHASFQPPLSTNQGIGPRKLWEDVYNGLDGAKHLIYIAGWSLNPNLVLIRDSQTDITHGKGVKLGELLKRKAEEGVAVRVMLWDDETSIPLIKNKGLMRTHDEDAFAYFKPTKVVCRLCPRLHNKFPTFFSHHQKTITVDTRASDSSISHREITSFIGGVDLCDGRYDTEEHSLFRTLNTDSHCKDFYQTSVEGASLHKGGPREPWHDAHACITGEAAWDVLTNFEQRWSKQCDPSLLVPVSSIANLPRDSCQMISDSPHRNWKVQVFRSIDHFSASPISSRASMTEQSIHEAYVEAIRKADRFIYIENQYFLGGCGLWAQDQHSGCKNLIPIEIALKVANKIRARERFAAYILIPMWPEGVPENESVEDILHWTRATMEMMYSIIGEALTETSNAGHPRDYLNFFCLANREAKLEREFVPPLSPHPSTQYWKAQRNRRFMVYVHSKIMIVDDMYMIIGSANVNQRSMDGARDTEIAIGCYQSGKGDQSSGIKAYRMALWYEHTGRAEEWLEEPESGECVEKMRRIGEEMWGIYAGEEVVDMKGVHLVGYPVRVNQDGSVEECEGSGVFPDTQTPVRGKRSMVLPSIFTT